MNGHPFSLIYGCTMRDERQSAAVRLSIFPSVPDGYNQEATHDLPHHCGKCPVRRVADCAGFRVATARLVCRYVRRQHLAADHEYCATGIDFRVGADVSSPRPARRIIGRTDIWCGIAFVGLSDGLADGEGIEGASGAAWGIYQHHR